MSSKTAKLLGAGIVILLLIEIVGTMVMNRAEEENKNPIGSDGKIKEGYTVSFEQEKEMAINSFPEVDEEEYNEQLLYAISQCILTSKSLNSYECIGNNVADSYFNNEQKELSLNDKGYIVYRKLVKNHTPTGVNTKLMETDEDSQMYEVVISTLERKIPLTYIFTLEGKKIQFITESEGE